MRKSIGCIAAMMCAMGIAGNVGAAANNSSPAPLTQAAVPVAQQPDYLLKTCQESASASDIDPKLAVHAVDPAYGLANYLNSHSSEQVVFDLTAIKTTLLEGTKHGDVLSSTSNYGRTTYRYVPSPNYVGNERAVFLAEFEGKVYKIVINFVVSLRLNENPLTDEDTPVCPEPQLIEVKKRSSGSSQN